MNVDSSVLSTVAMMRKSASDLIGKEGPFTPPPKKKVLAIPAQRQNLEIADLIGRGAAAETPSIWI